MRRMQQEYYTILGFNLQFGEAISELAAIGGTSNCSNEGWQLFLQQRILTLQLTLCDGFFPKACVISKSMCKLKER